MKKKKHYAKFKHMKINTVYNHQNNKNYCLELQLPYLFSYKAHSFFNENLFFCGKFMPKLVCVLYIAEYFRPTKSYDRHFTGTYK